MWTLPLGPENPSLSIRVLHRSCFGESLLSGGFKPQVGSVGDALSNALAETTIGFRRPSV